MWPMPLADVLEEMKNLEAHGVDSPRSAEDLGKAVRILLKSSGPLPASLIANATVRRDVVVALIQDGKQRRHPSFASLNMSDIKAKAKIRLPESGVMPELVAQLGHDHGLCISEYERHSSQSENTLARIACDDRARHTAWA